MSVELEKQSLATLKEWTQALGIRGMSNARKAELINLLSQVGEARIEHAIKLLEEKKKPAKPETPPEAAPQPRSEEAPAQRPNYLRGGDMAPAPRSGGRGGFGSYAPSYRAQAEAVETLARNIFADEEASIDTVLAFFIPHTRAFMHLDTVFTQVMGFDSFQIVRAQGTSKSAWKAERDMPLALGKLDEEFTRFYA